MLISVTELASVSIEMSRKDLCRHHKLWNFVKIIENIILCTVYNTFKTDTKYSHSVRSRPTLKDKECFRNGLVRKSYERSLYERTLMSEPSFHRETCYIN